MPIKSEQQRRFMAMCLHSPEKAKDKCPPKGVAKKFIHGHKRKDEMNYHYFNFLNQYLLNINEQTDEDIDDGEAEGMTNKQGQSVEKGKVGRAGHFLRVHTDPQPGSSEEEAAKKALKLRLKVARALGMGTPTGGTDSGNIRTGKR